MKTTFHRFLFGALLATALLRPALAQTSPSFKLTESTIDAGGNPLQGSRLTSAHYHVKFDAIGETVVRVGLGSASFHMDGGFVGRYPPPSEVKGLRFSNRTTLRWNPERSIGRYEVYRGGIASLPGSFGTCFASGLASETTNDAASPAKGAGYFYIVTARNTLLEEGAKGYQSSGAEESNMAPCP